MVGLVPRTCGLGLEFEFLQPLQADAERKHRGGRAQRRHGNHAEDDLGADSLDTVELVMALEEEFETEIPDEEAEKIATVQQAVDYIKAHSKS